MSPEICEEALDYALKRSAPPRRAARWVRPAADCFALALRRRDREVHDGRDAQGGLRR
jgi:hypothetical protein